MIRALRLPLDCDLPRVQADLAAIASAEWHPHFNTGYYRGNWSGIPLRAQPGIHVPLYTDPTRDDYADTAAMGRCAYVPSLLEKLRCPLESVRMLRLGPGSTIREHRDAGLRFEEDVLRLHIPVHTNSAVEFRLGAEPLHLVEGECWYLNFDLPHSVNNRGNTDRIHLVIDARVNEWVRDWFASAVPAAPALA